jgi:hypothetical protein
MKEGRQERRWSERLLKITDESNKNMTLPDQGSTEGNQLFSNSFSALGSDMLIEKSNGMGVVIEKSDFAAINIISEMEKARQLLYEKTKIVPLETENEDSGCLISENECDSVYNGEGEIDEYIEEEASDSDGFQVVIQPRRRVKPNRLSLSGKKKK